MNQTQTGCAWSSMKEFGHNLPQDVVQMHAEHWFRLYMNPTNPPPKSPGAPVDLKQSVIRSQINAADHRKVVGAEDKP